MDFQPWRDYFQLSSLVQKMARMDIGKPQPAKYLLINHIEPTQGQVKGKGPSSYDFLPCVTPFKDELPGSFKPLDSYFQAGLNSSHNLNPTEHLAYNQCQPTTLDDLETELHMQNKCSNNHPAASSTKREARSRFNICHFCKHNGESRHVYSGHNLKDEQGKVICPILRMYRCSLCGATGDVSHTRKYCPLNMNKFGRKIERNSAGHRMKH